MAKQTGPNFFTGTVGITCFYKRGSQYLMRHKSSLTAEMVNKSSRFANTRKSAGELATASRLASQVYRSLPKEKRYVTLYRKMTGIAKVMLTQEKEAQVIIHALREYAGNRIVNRKLSRVNSKGWGVNKEGRLHAYPVLALKENIGFALQKERKRYFKISNRSVSEIVNPVIDDCFLSLVDFLGFRRPIRLGRSFRDTTKKKVKYFSASPPVSVHIFSFPAFGMHLNIA